MTSIDKAELIARVERLRPFELGDDPAAWRQADTVDRVLDIINAFEGSN